MLDVFIHVNTHIVRNNMAANFNKECLSFILAIVSIFSYLLLLPCVFNTVHVKFMY